MNIHCAKCGAVVFEGKDVYHEYPTGSGNYEQEIEGEYVDGGGMCKCCKRHLCEDCGDFINGFCQDCREYDSDDIPF